MGDGGETVFPLDMLPYVLVQATQVRLICGLSVHAEYLHSHLQSKEEMMHVFPSVKPARHPPNQQAHSFVAISSATSLD